MKNNRKLLKQGLLIAASLIFAIQIGGCDNNNDADGKDPRESYDCNKIIKEADKIQEQLTQTKTDIEKVKADIERTQSNINAVNSQRLGGQ